MKVAPTPEIFPEKSVAVKIPVTITPPSPFTFTDSVLPVFNLISDAVPPLALTVSVISSEPLASTSRSPGVAIICLLSPNFSDTLSFN